MEGNKVHYRHSMLFFYRKGKNVTQTTNKIWAIYGDGAIAERIVRKWFPKFKADDFNLEDQERPSRPSVIDKDQIKTLPENNPRYMTCELAEISKILKSNIHEHFVKPGYIIRSDI